MTSETSNENSDDSDVWSVTIEIPDGFRDPEDELKLTNIILTDTITLFTLTLLSKHVKSIGFN